jgi:outer membrane lipoprotein-sorting protein
VNILRRLPLSRLLLLCGLVVAIGIGITALALAVGGGPTPPAKPLPEAVHDALAGAKEHPIQGVSARIQFSNHLLEGANLAGDSGAGGGGSGGGSSSGGVGSLLSSPLVTGADGRLWISSDGRARLELQSEQGDSQLLYDGHTVSLYDAASNTLYRYTPKQGSSGEDTGTGTAGESGSSPSDTIDQHAIPTVAEIEEAVTKASGHGATISGATPTNVAGQPAYTVRISPSRNGGLIGGVELSWDAANGAPLRAAIYSSTSSTPVIELAATEISYGPIENSVFEVKPPASAKVEEVAPPTKDESSSGTAGGSAQSSGSTPTHSSEGAPKVTTHGEGLAGIAVVEAQAKGDSKESESLESLPQVKINGTTASEMATPLGTLLTFERSGIRYLLAGSVTPASIEAFARGM